jgi:hypothetical protein
MKTIPLNHGRFAFVDDEDFYLISKFKWFSYEGRHTFYAGRNICEGSKWIKIPMHRVLMGLLPRDGKTVDHKNQNGLDNRKRNLRIVSTSLNISNSKIWATNTSGYRGVSWRKDRKKWRSFIMVKGKQINCGHYNDIIEAAKAHDRSILQYRGDAPLNFPVENYL